MLTPTTFEIVKTATEYTVNANGAQVGVIRPRILNKRTIGYTWIPARGSGSPVAIRAGDTRSGFQLHTVASALLACKAIAYRAQNIA
jgi:hypothetical protein